MSIYNLQCEDCGENFTVEISSDDLKQVSCPVCQSEDIKQQSTLADNKNETDVSNDCPDSG